MTEELERNRVGLFLATVSRAAALAFLRCFDCRGRFSLDRRRGRLDGRSFGRRLLGGGTGATGQGQGCSSGRQDKQLRAEIHNDFSSLSLSERDVQLFSSIEAIFLRHKPQEGQTKKAGDPQKGPPASEARSPNRGANFVFDAASYDEHLHATRLEPFSQGVEGLVHVDGTPAVEQVQRGVPVFGPSVDRVVRLLDDDRPTDAVGLEFVEGLLHNRRLGIMSSLHHGIADRVFEFERVLVTVEKLNQKVRTERGALAWLERKSLFIVEQPIAERMVFAPVNQGPTMIHRGFGRSHRCHRFANKTINQSGPKPRSGRGERGNECGQCRQRCEER